MLDSYKEAIQAANENGLLIGDDQNILSGFSGEKLVGAIQRLIRTQNESESSCYLEVGVFQGLTLLSASLANPEVACYGVDNFSFF
jgi:hypothetical protein